MDITIDSVRASDSDALSELYANNNGLQTVHIGRLRPDVRHDVVTLAARTQDRIIGMVLMTYLDDGVHRYGILHVLEVDRPAADYAHGVRSALVNACRDWLAKWGATQLLAAPQIDSDLILDALHSLKLKKVQQDQFPPDGEPGVVRVARRIWV